jgi:glycosyltransferase involved in cell wall biosynthesis
MDKGGNIRAAFVMEQHLGHVSFYKNLNHFVEESPGIRATWVRVTYEDPASPWDRLSFLPKHLRGSLTGRYQVRRGLARAEYDIALFNTQVPAVLSGDLLSKKPYILCTDITPLQYDAMAGEYMHKPDRPGPVQQYKHRVNAQIFQNASRILPWSNWTGDSLIHDYGVSPKNIEVIPPGIDLDVWRPGKKQGPGPLRILFVGGDFYRKGGDLLLKACEQLPPGMVELHLVTRSSIAQKDWIIVYNNMIPNSPELIRLYQTCDIFVLPTNAEAFGIAAAEAAASGLPGIATSIGGLTDIIDHGETGFLIQPRDLQALVKYIQELVSDTALRQRFSQAARSKAEKCFNAKTNACRVIEILREITTNL